MKILNASEVKNVSGGFDAVTTLCALTAANLALGVYNANQITKLNKLAADADYWIDFLYEVSVYQEAQLSLLPEYSRVRSLSINTAMDLFLS